MKMYTRTSDDAMSCLNRCFFDARHGRVELAMARIDDLESDFPDNAEIMYSRGLLLKDFLGRGIDAQRCFVSAWKTNQNHFNAACNAAIYSPTEDEYSEWITIATRMNADDEQMRHIRDYISDSTGDGVPYCQTLIHRAEMNRRSGDFGGSAAFAELALVTAAFPLQDEIECRRARAQSLRALDQGAETFRATIWESFPPEERLALHEALLEIERAIELSEYEPELWNLRASWLYLLGRHGDALASAERAIALRPDKYPKPHHNKAIALWELGRPGEALDAEQESLRQAREISSANDVDLATQTIEQHADEGTDKPNGDPGPIISHILNAARLTSEQEQGQWQGHTETLTRGLLQRARLARGLNSIAYVPFMAELLSDFTPETAWQVTLGTAAHSQEIHDHLLHAALFVATHGEGVARRDAGRFLALYLMGAMELDDIRRAYREAVLLPSAAARDDIMNGEDTEHREFAFLDRLVTEEMRRILPGLADRITDQPPATAAEIEKARRTILSRFTGKIPAAYAPPPGCKVLLICLALIAAAIIAWFLLNC